MLSNFTNPDDYFNNLPTDRKEGLLKLRQVIKELLPHAEETMHYNMPTYKIGESFVALASQKNYMCLYVCYPEILEKFEGELKHLNSGKGCIRYKRAEDLPMDTIKNIVKEIFKNEGL